MNLFAWHVPKPKKEVTTRKNNSHIFLCVCDGCSSGGSTGHLPIRRLMVRFQSACKISFDKILQTLLSSLTSVIQCRDGIIHLLLS